METVKDIELDIGVAKQNIEDAMTDLKQAEDKLEALYECFEKLKEYDEEKGT